ncbi:hypothetical protein TRVA0_001S10682 [Trichomonascus vanleenenianus]|uniref:uncharacterized protein n=1 Tax=Trichomonascus vanleenenianus TaxID=2268995 RepID=UPI003ECA3D7B
MEYQISQDVYAKQLIPDRYTWKDALEVGALFHKSFQNEMWQWWGESYFLDFKRPVSDISNGITDPRERLDALITKMTCYKRICRVWARISHLELLDRGSLVLGMYHNSRLIGYCSWILPRYMKDDPIYSNGKSGLLYWLYYWFKRCQYRVADWWDHLGQPEHVINNERKEHYIDHPQDCNDLPPNDKQSEGMLSQLGRHNAIGMALYRPMDMCYLSSFIIDPDYQRKGLGKKFLECSINAIPNIGPTFRSSHSQCSGPQKLFLKSSKAGLPFYKSLGFEETVEGESCENVHLIRTR